MCWIVNHNQANLGRWVSGQATPKICRTFELVILEKYNLSNSNPNALEII